jgi:hypothetical protein
MHALPVIQRVKSHVSTHERTAPVRIVGGRRKELR